MTSLKNYHRSSLLEIKFRTLSSCLIRRIVLSSVFGKPFKKLLKKRLFWYLKSNNLLSFFQYSYLITSFRPPKWNEWIFTHQLLPLFRLLRPLESLLLSVNSIYKVIFLQYLKFSRQQNFDSQNIKYKSLPFPSLAVGKNVPQSNVFSVLFFISNNNITKESKFHSYNASSPTTTSPLHYCDLRNVHRLLQYHHYPGKQLKQE